MLLISYCFALSIAQAQSVDISVPLEGAVFQQDGTGFGNLTVQGTLIGGVGVLHQAEADVFGNDFDAYYQRCSTYVVNRRHQRYQIDYLNGLPEIDAIHRDRDAVCPGMFGRAGIRHFVHEREQDTPVDFSAKPGRRCD